MISARYAPRIVGAMNSVHRRVRLSLGRDDLTRRRLCRYARMIASTFFEMLRKASAALFLFVTILVKAGPKPS